MRHDGFRGPLPMARLIFLPSLEMPLPRLRGHVRLVHESPRRRRPRLEARDGPGESRLSPLPLLPTSPRHPRPRAGAASTSVGRGLPLTTHLPARGVPDLRASAPAVLGFSAPAPGSSAGTRCPSRLSPRPLAVVALGAPRGGARAGCSRLGQACCLAFIFLHRERIDVHTPRSCLAVPAFRVRVGKGWCRFSSQKEIGAGCLPFIAALISSYCIQSALRAV